MTGYFGLTGSAAEIEVSILMSLFRTLLIWFQATEAIKVNPIECCTISL